MKKCIIYLLAILMMAAACTRESRESHENLESRESLDPSKQEVTPSNAKTVTVYAGGAGTKTLISESNGQFSLSWSARDQIAVWEAVPYIIQLKQNPDYNGYISQRYESDPLEDPGATAIFNLNLAPRADVTDHGDIQYVAIYPAECAVDNYDCWEEDGMLVPINMPDVQHPTADSFDPKADVLVSKTVHCNNTRPDQLSFQFARVGTIVKMVLANLPPGAKVLSGSINFGFESGYYFLYDPEREYIPSRDGVEFLYFQYNSPGIPVGEDGKVTVWLRSMSGISKRLELYLDYTFNGEDYFWHRIINLQAAGKTLEFKEGGLTEFTIGKPMPDIENPDPDTINYQTDENGVTVSWPVSDDEDFESYECSLLGEDGRWHYFTSTTITDGIFYGTFGGELEPGYYTLYIRTIAKNGKVSQPDYVEKVLAIGF